MSTGSVFFVVGWEPPSLSAPAQDAVVRRVLRAREQWSEVIFWAGDETCSPECWEALEELGRQLDASEVPSEHEEGRVVFVLKTGVYDSRTVVGVYASLEAAQAAADGRWFDHGGGFWSNDLDWDDAADIHRMSVEGVSR